MSNDANSELLEVLRNMREQTKFLRELSIEHLALDSWPQAETFSAPVHRVAAPTPAKTSTQEHPPSQPTREFVSPTSALRQVESLFGEMTLAEPALPESSETLEQIWTDIGDCTRCGLCEGRTQVVNTHGNRQARLMFVGEAPGADEDAQGKPFVGRAGQLLTKMIEAMGMKREDVIIGNVNRCRPPGNRQPTLEEAAICRPFLFREIAAIQPQVIVVMGNTALRNLLEVREGITRVRGTFQDFRGIKVMPTFHPAYLLRDPSKKRETWEDLKMVRDYLENTPRKS
ncbi:MAG TPA: uracil-DNA glycosylase [Pyrinomonadaceae bacterium]|jgi:DNA polymerase|nr:uracil-DNA glycosylase [Pyrinomonadaceae bacterium]